MRSPKSPTPNQRGSKVRARANLTSYYRSANETGRPSPFRPKPSAHPARRILFGAADIILAIVLVAGLIYSLLVNSSPQIKVTDQTYHSLAEYRSQITPLLGGVQNRNKLTFNEPQVVGRIQSRFPEVQSAHVELPFFSERAVVWLNISAPELLLGNPSGSYIIDSQGTAVARPAQLPNLKNLVILTDQSGYNSQVGKQVLSSEAVSFIMYVADQAKSSGVKISSLTLPPLAQEFDLRAAGQPYFVKFYLGGDAKLQVGQYLAARSQFNRSGQGPAEYLDVRVPGKIFYK
jgi:hypothetical protein